MSDLDREIGMAKISFNQLVYAGEGGTFLDLGSNIGEVSILAAPRFDQVVAVEAHPDTFELGRRRVEAAGLQDKIKLINAVVTKTGGESWFVTTPKYSTGASARPVKRRKNDDAYYRTSQTVAAQDLVDEHRPRVLKMDIEGCEYDCLEDLILPSCLDHIVVEFHHATSRKNFDRLLKCGENLNRQGLSLVHPTSINPNPEGCLKYGYSVFKFSRRDPVVSVDEVICSRR